MLGLSLDFFIDFVLLDLADFLQNRLPLQILEVHHCILPAECANQILGSIHTPVIIAQCLCNHLDPFLEELARACADQIFVIGVVSVSLGRAHCTLELLQKKVKVFVICSRLHQVVE